MKKILKKKARLIGKKQNQVDNKKKAGRVSSSRKSQGPSPLSPRGTLTKPIRKGPQRAIQELERKLLGRRQEIVEVVGHLKQDIDSGESDNTGDLSTLPQHLADLGSQEYDQSLNFALTESAEQELRDIDDALRKIQEGTYGLCEQCEQFIGLERLNALPFTTQCIACKTQEEG